MSRHADRSFVVVRASGLVLLASLAFTPSPTAVTDGGPAAPAGPPPHLIVHALGMAEGWPIRNCRECFETSVTRGYCWLEADFLETSDGGLAVTHDGLEEAMALPRPFTIEQFRHARLLGALHPLDAAGLAALMREHAHTVVVTDFKSDLLRGLPILIRELESAGVDWRRRLVPQVYSPAQLDPTLALGVERVIFTMYRFGNHPDQVLAIAGSSPRVMAVAMPEKWFTPGLPAAFHAAGKLILVHTVNDRVRADELLALGVDSIYTDVLDP